MATTTPDNLWSPDGGDAYALTTDLAAMQDTVQEALTGLRNSASYRTMTDADRLALAGADLFEGLTVWATDTRIEWRYSNGSWGRMTNIVRGNFQLPIQGVGVNQTVPITFPAGAFTAAPNISITPSNGRVTASLVAGSVTATGATLGFDNWSNGPVGSPHTVYWTAIGV